MFGRKGRPKTACIGLSCHVMSCPISMMFFRTNTPQVSGSISNPQPTPSASWPSWQPSLSLAFAKSWVPIRRSNSLIQVKDLELIWMHIDPRKWRVFNCDPFSKWCHTWSNYQEMSMQQRCKPAKIGMDGVLVAKIMKLTGIVGPPWRPSWGLSWVPGVSSRPDLRGKIMANLKDPKSSKI